MFRISPIFGADIPMVEAASHPGAASSGAMAVEDRSVKRRIELNPEDLL